MSKEAKSILSNVLYIAGVLFLSFLIVRYVGQRTEVIGNSMVPTLQDEDQLICPKVELALNINTIPDSKVAEKLYNEYYIYDITNATNGYNFRTSFIRYIKNYYIFDIVLCV